MKMCRYTRSQSHCHSINARVCHTSPNALHNSLNKPSLDDVSLPFYQDINMR